MLSNFRFVPLQLLAVLTAIGFGDPVEASPLELFGFGARSPAMAGAGVADSEGFASVYLNPAGLAAVTRERLTIGTVVTRFGLSIDGRSASVDNGTALVIGGVIPIPLGGSMVDRVVLGLGFHIPNQALVRVDRPAVGTPTFALLDNRADAVGIQAAIGVRISDRLSLGGGVLILGGLRGTIKIRNDAGGAFLTTSDQRVVTHVAPIVGSRYRMSTTTTVGVTIRSPSRSDYDIVIDTELDAIPLGLPELAVAGNAQYDPLMIALGGVMHLREGVRLLADLEYRRWSGFPRPTENPVITNPAPPPPKFHDTAVPKLAIEVEHLFGTIVARARAGYAFHWSPAPEMKGPISLLDNHRHVIGVGGSASLSIGTVPIHFDAWAQVHLLQSRRHRKDPSLFGDDPPLSQTIDSSGQVLASGLTIGVDL